MRHRCFLALFAALTVSPTCVAAPIFTALPETSATYPAGTNIAGLTSTTADPLAPFQFGESVWFRGWQVGGNTTDLSGVSRLIYRYRIDFGELTQIDQITIRGWAFNGPDNVLRLLDSDMNVVSTVPTFGGNSLQTISMAPVNALGSVFFLDEYDTSTASRYRTNFEVAFTPVAVPEPASLAIWSALGGLGLLTIRFRRR